jgi:hypothetical protein
MAKQATDNNRTIRMIPPGHKYAMLSLSDSILEIGAFWTRKTVITAFKMSLDDIEYGHIGEKNELFLAETVFQGLLKHFHHRWVALREDRHRKLLQ